MLLYISPLYIHSWHCCYRTLTRRGQEKIKETFLWLVAKIGSKVIEPKIIQFQSLHLIPIFHNHGYRNNSSN